MIAFMSPAENNRNVWGALQALESIASEVPDVLAKNLDAIVDAADKGSVIAKDKAVGILSSVARAGHAKAVPVLLERVMDAAPNQFPMYAELALPAIPAPAAETDPQFDTCKDAKAAGYGPYVQGVDPEYDWYRDRDKDVTNVHKLLLLDPRQGLWGAAS